MKAHIVVALSITVALTLTATADAGLPKAKTTLIVPSKSIGGVALGASSKAVAKAWGKTAKCEYQCLYEGKASGELASVLLETKSTGATPKVWSIFISVAQTPSGSTPKPNFNTVLTAFKTSKGIGLGSKLSELKKAYHQLKKSPGLSAPTAVYSLAGPKESSTTFTLTSNRVTTIGITAHPGG